MLADAVDWTNVLVALIASLPALIAAIAAVATHRQVKPPSGGKLGDVAERALSLAAIGNEHSRRNSVKLDQLKTASDERKASEDATA